MSNVTVGTVRKSIAMVPARWSRTNVFQVCEGGRSGRSGGFGMYLATVSLSTQRGFSREIRSIDRPPRARSSKYASGPRNRKAAQRTTQASMAAVARYPTKDTLFLYAKDDGRAIAIVQRWSLGREQLFACLAGPRRLELSDACWDIEMFGVAIQNPL